MKIGVLSDTHGSLPAVRKVLQAAPPVECWLHAGDYAGDANLIGTTTGLPVYTVRGNCDGWQCQSLVDEYLEFEGFKLWLSHGNRYLRNGGEAELAWWAHKLEMQVAVFGHTHVPFVKWTGEILLLNPGSPALPRGGYEPSFAVLTLNAGQQPAAEIITLPK